MRPASDARSAAKVVVAEPCVTCALVDTHIAGNHAHEVRVLHSRVLESTVCLVLNRVELGERQPQRIRRNDGEVVIVKRPSGPEVRASAARIVDILQQLVLARPEMIIPLEEIVRGILANLRVHVEEQIWKREDQSRSRGRTRLPPMPLSDLPALLALLEPPTDDTMMTAKRPSIVAGHRWTLDTRSKRILPRRRRA